MRTKGWMALLLGSMLVACGSCTRNNNVPAPGEDTSARTSATAGGLYSRFNLHYYAMRGVNRASYANYVDCPGHGLLPYNTRFRVNRGRNGFRLTALDTGMVIEFEYRSANMGGMAVDDYIDLIMSPAPVSYSDLTAQDQEGIQAGRAMTGMTKQGVMVALGYPAKSKTPSTDLNTWVYWKGRFNMLTVNFGDDGKVTSVR
jgi:hypothetical protein